MCVCVWWTAVPGLCWWRTQHRQRLAGNTGYQLPWWHRKNSPTLWFQGEPFLLDVQVLRKERMIIISSVDFCSVFRGHAHCVNIAFFRVPYTFWPHHCISTQNDWTPVEQVMAHWWMLRHSTLDLLANSVSSKTIQLHSCQSTMSSQLWPCTPLPCTASLQSMKGGIRTMTK